MPRLVWIPWAVAIGLLWPITRPAFAQPWNAAAAAAAAAFRQPEHANAAAIAAAFDARANAVITMNACSREDDYLGFRAAMAGGDFGDEGENLGHILVAKVAYIRSNLPEPCQGTIVRYRPRNSDGTYDLRQFATLRDFAKADKAVRADGAKQTYCAVETSETEQNDRGEAKDAVFVNLDVSRECMVRQVNEAILAMRKTTKLGSSDLYCVDYPGWKGSKGEFDVNVRELVRLLYLGASRGRDPGILWPKTIDHMYAALLATSGKPSDDSYSVLAGCAQPADDELGSPEDRADKHTWYNKLGESLGDAFDWLFKFFVRAAAAYAFASAVTATGGLIEIPFLILNVPQQAFLPWTDISVPETENHRLMIESSRFLVNADIIDRLQVEGYDADLTDGVREDQKAVREWLLHRLQDIAAHDFQEYNARPYTRYSLNAILNLHDFAARYGDAPMARAAQIVLDLSEAKFAATSNAGRRAAPFRRRSELDGYDLSSYKTAGAADLYNIVSGGDHEVARAMLLSGQTQLLPLGPSLPALAEMVNAAASHYRLPPPVLAAAVERRKLSQTIKHTGVERVFQSPAFTISAGGVRTGPTATVLGKSDDIDKGVAMPTVIMPTVAGLKIADLFRFDGVGEQNNRTDNTCVAEGFACGVSPQIPALFAHCTIRNDSAGLVFVSSQRCIPGTGPHFYLAARLSDCSGSFCGPGRRWGLMEVVESKFVGPGDDPAFDRFQAERSAALLAVSADFIGIASYLTSARRRIDFTVAEVGPKIIAIDGAPPPDWTTAGDVIDADGKGRATIKGPGGPVTIDFSDWSNPKRTPP